MFRHWGPTTVRTVDLGYDQMLVLQGRPGTRVRVLYGSAWLTEEGCAQDIFAGSGGEVALRGGGRTVVEGLGVARVQVIAPPRGQLWRRFKVWAQHAIARLPRPGLGAAARCA
jgi:hypothetical protein